MKVRNTSARVINLMHGDTKLTLIPGTDEVYEVTDCADVQWYLDKGDLAEAFERSKPKPAGDDDQPGKKNTKQTKKAEK